MKQLPDRILKHQNNATEHNCKVRKPDKLKFKVLIFSNRQDGINFVNNELDKYGYSVEYPINNFSGCTQYTPLDKKFFAFTVFCGPPTLGILAHESFHIAERYIWRTGINKKWGIKSAFVEN